MDIQDDINEIRKDCLKKLKKNKYNFDLKKFDTEMFNFCESYANYNNCAFLLNQIYKNKFDEFFELFETTDLVNRIINKEVELENLFTLSPEELNPKKYESIISKKEKLKRLQDNSGKTDLKCKKCKSNKFNIEQRQIRSGDEPATTFVTCLECGFTYKY